MIPRTPRELGAQTAADLLACESVERGFVIIRRHTQGRASDIDDYAPTDDTRAEWYAGARETFREWCEYFTNRDECDQCARCGKPEPLCPCY